MLIDDTDSLYTIIMRTGVDSGGLCQLTNSFGQTVKTDDLVRVHSQKIHTYSP
jgi:hypothetical protein